MKNGQDKQNFILTDKQTSILLAYIILKGIQIYTTLANVQCLAYSCKNLAIACASSITVSPTFDVFSFEAVLAKSRTSPSLMTCVLHHSRRFKKGYTIDKIPPNFKQWCF